MHLLWSSWTFLEVVSVGKAKGDEDDAHSTAGLALPILVNTHPSCKNQQETHNFFAERLRSEVAWNPLCRFKATALHGYKHMWQQCHWGGTALLPDCCSFQGVYLKPLQTENKGSSLYPGTHRPAPTSHGTDRKHDTTTSLHRKHPQTPCSRRIRYWPGRGRAFKPRLLRRRRPIGRCPVPSVKGWSSPPRRLPGGLLPGVGGSALPVADTSLLPSRAPRGSSPRSPWATAWKRGGSWRSWAPGSGNALPGCGLEERHPSRTCPEPLEASAAEVRSLSGERWEGPLAQLVQVCEAPLLRIERLPQNSLVTSCRLGNYPLVLSCIAQTIMVANPKNTVLETCLEQSTEAQLGCSSVKQHMLKWINNSMVTKSWMLLLQNVWLKHASAFPLHKILESTLSLGSVT